jgi:hypothetical protein
MPAPASGRVLPTPDQLGGNKREYEFILFNNTK